MSARRRRVGSESEQAPLIISTDSQRVTDSYDKHAGKLKNYTTVPHTESDNSIIPKEILRDTMTARDRTREFVGFIQTLQSKQITRAVNVRDPRKSMYVQGHAEFMMIARTIGKNIASSYAKLEKLTLLAKKKSIFDDRPKEIQELTYIIKEDLNSLNQQIARLQEVAKSQKKGQQNGRKHLLSHSSSVVVALQSKLASMSTEFKQVLEVRTESLKHQKSRRDQFSQLPVSSAIPPSSLNHRSQGPLLVQDDQVAIDFEGDSASMPLLQSQRQLAYDQTDDYLQSRVDTMQNIESTIVELGGIFQQLAHMVKEQEEMVDRIDTNIESTSMNVEAAHTEILRYFQSVTSNRWLMIKIFGVLIFFFVFFVIFMT